MNIGELKKVIIEEGLSDDDEIMISREGIFTTFVVAERAEWQEKSYLEISEE